MGARRGSPQRKPRCRPDLAFTPKEEEKLGKGSKNHLFYTFIIIPLMSLESVTSRQTLLTLLPLFPTFAWTHDSVWPRRELVRMQCKAWG